MKSFLLLVRVNLQNLLGGLKGGSFRKSGGKLDWLRIFTYLAAGLGILLGAAGIIWLEYELYQGLTFVGGKIHTVIPWMQGNLGIMLPALALLLSMLTTVVFSLFHTLSAMYFNKDTAAKAYLPVSGRAIMAAKWAEIYVTEVLFSIAFLLPAVILYGMDVGGNALYYLRAVTILLVSPLYPLTISLVLSSLLARVTGLTRHKEMWAVLGTIVLLVVVLTLEMNVMPGMEDVSTIQLVGMLIAPESLLNRIIGAFPPVLWAVEGIKGSMAQWLLFLGVGVGAAALAVALLGGGYLHVCLKQTEQGTRSAKRRAKREKGDYRQRSPLMALFLRELNEVFKVPVYLLNGVMGELIMPIMLVSMYVGISQSGEGATVMTALRELLEVVSPVDIMLIAAGLLSFMCFIMPLTSTAVSREGGRMPISRMIPVPARTQLLAKMLPGLALNLLSSVLLAVALGVFLGASFAPWLLGAVVLANLLSYATNTVCLTIDAMRPILHWKNETQVMKRNMNQVLGMLVDIVLLALPAVPPFFLLSQGPWVRLAVVAAILLVECALGLALLRGVAEKRYAQIEP